MENRLEESTKRRERGGRGEWMNPGGNSGDSEKEVMGGACAENTDTAFHAPF